MRSEEKGCACIGIIAAYNVYIPHKSSTTTLEDGDRPRKEAGRREGNMGKKHNASGPRAPCTPAKEAYFQSARKLHPTEGRALERPHRHDAGLHALHASAVVIHLSQNQNRRPTRSIRRLRRSL